MMTVLLRVPLWHGSDGSSGVVTSFLTGRSGVRQRLYYCAFVQIRDRQPHFAAPTPIGIDDIRNWERVTALPIKSCFKEQT